MTTATVAVKGSASDDFPADFAVVAFGHGFEAAARSDALAGGNAVIAELREMLAQLSGVREVSVVSLHTQEMFDHEGSHNTREHSGWVAHLRGQVRVDASAVPRAIAELIKIGVEVSTPTWHLDEETQLQAHRAMRRRAVADAREAASDFALALGATLGPLITLADPGLLGAAGFAVGARSGAMMAMATSGVSGQWGEHVDIDPQAITIVANVEASYHVTLDE